MYNSMNREVMMNIKRMVMMNLKHVLILVVAVTLYSAGISPAQNTSLMIQKSPSNGGTVSPAGGVHGMEAYTEVRISAVPNTGYEFVYWLGDVADPASSNTTMYLGGPKIVIAVFQRSQYESLAAAEYAKSRPNTGLVANRVSISAAGAVSPAGPTYDLPDYSIPDIDQEALEDILTPNLPDDVLVPDEPIPEPATVILLGTGWAIMAGKKRLFRKSGRS